MTGTQSILCPKCGKKVGERTVTLKRVLPTVRARCVCQECHDIFNEQQRIRAIERNKKKVTGKQDVLCFRCGGKMGEVTVEKRYIRQGQTSTSLCPACLARTHEDRSANMKLRNTAEFRQKASERMKRNNPMKGKIKRVPKIPNPNWREEASERMRTNNPMKNTETRKKVSNTINKRLRSGDLKYPHGPRHRNWKGNRPFNLAVRTQLNATWTKMVFKRDNYTCTRCSARGGILHGHHVRPLRDIIKQVLLAEGVTDIAAIQKEDANRYFELIEKVVSEHHLEDGITLCHRCHGIVDKRYRRKHEN